MIPFCSHGVYFRCALLVCDEEVEGDCGEEGRLAVFPPHKEHGLPKAAVACLLLPKAEKGLNVSLLEKLKVKRGSDHALGLLAKPLRKFNGPLPGLLVEKIWGVCLGLCDFPGEAFIDLPNSAAYYDPTGLDLLVVDEDVVHFFATPGALVINPISSSPALLCVVLGRRSRRLFERVANDLIVAL